jgi:hypothetical protein
MAVKQTAYESLIQNGFNYGIIQKVELVDFDDVLYYPSFSTK